MAGKTPKTADYLADLQATAAKLRSVMDGIELHGDGEHDSTISNLARVATALTTCCAELRQHARQSIREVERIPLDQILTYLRTLPEAKRADIARDITNADAQEGLL